MASTSLLRGTRGYTAGNLGTPRWLAMGSPLQDQIALRVTWTCMQHRDL